MSLWEDDSNFYQLGIETTAHKVTFFGSLERKSNKWSCCDLRKMEQKMCLLGEFFIDFTAARNSTFFLNWTIFFRKTIVFICAFWQQAYICQLEAKKLAFNTCLSFSFLAQKKSIYLGQKNCNTHFIWRRLFFLDDCCI